ncbi:MFS transporter [Archaeoglobus neptunius]|uniref:MFS transporter n=1 Tax=Archaeoglobus neptunius TaxID=2798580 RepID=UPI0019297564|nr:MFS transporter [Archaeoglobus neptunius]
MRNYRWVVLVMYIFAGIISQIMWITFSPILPIVERIYSIGEAEVGMLSAVYPLVFIVFALPVGWYVDKSGFRKAVLTGSAFFAVSGFLRAFASSFTALLAFQTLGAVGQPFIFNSISKLVKSWFPEEEAGLATGLGSISLFIGTIIGLGATPALTVAFGFRNMLLVYALAATFILVLFYLFGKESGMVEEEEYRFREYVEVLKNRNVLILSLIAFIGVGIFTAYLTWVEPVMEEHGLSVETAGITASALLLGGIAGSIVIPAASDKVGRRKPFLYVCFVLSALLFYVHTLASGMTELAILLFVLGFFFISALPLSLDLSATSVGEKYAGTANSSLWLLSQIGSVVLIVEFESLASAFNWNSTLLLSSALFLLSLALTALIKE